MHVLLFNLRQVILTLSFRLANLLCYGNHFSNVTFIDAYLLEVSWPYLQNHIGTSLKRPQNVPERRPQDVGRTRPL